MPSITPYEAQVNPQAEISTERASGASFGTGAGLSALGQGLEQGAKQVEAGIRRYQDRHQVVDSLPKVTALRGAIQDKIKGQTQSFDPEDPQAQENFFKDYDDSIKQITDGMSSPEATEYVMKSAENHKAALWQSALANNAKIQGREMAAKTHEQSAQLSQMAYKNPEMLDEIIQKEIPTFIHPLVGDDGKKGELSQQMIRASSLSAAHGMIRDNPYEAQKELESGTRFNHLDGADTSALLNAADSAIRARDRQAELAEKKAKVKEDQFMKENHQTLFHKIDDGLASPTDIEEAYQQQLIKPEQRDILNNRLNAIIKGTTEMGGPAYIQAQQRLSLPDGDPNKITDFQQLAAEYGTGKGSLAKQDIQTLSKMYLKPKGANNVDDAMFSQLVKDAQSKLIQPTFIPWGDRVGMNAYARFLNQAHADYTTKMATGKYTSEQLLSPNSKDYIGNSISAFQRSRSEMSAQAAYQLHGPRAALKTSGAPEQPPGSDPQKTPLPVPHTPSNEPPAMSDRMKSALQMLISNLPKKGGN